MTTDEFKELIDIIKWKEKSYQNIIDVYEHKKKELSLEIEIAKERYIQTNALFKIGDKAILKEEGKEFFIHDIKINNEYNFHYSLTEINLRDREKDSKAGGEMPSESVGG